MDCYLRKAHIKTKSVSSTITAISFQTYATQWPDTCTCTWKFGGQSEVDADGGEIEGCHMDHDRECRIWNSEKLHLIFWAKFDGLARDLNLSKVEAVTALRLASTVWEAVNVAEPVLTLRMGAKIYSHDWKKMLKVLNKRGTIFVYF